jgi:hypothetical protein
MRAPTLLLLAGALTALVLSSCSGGGMMVGSGGGSSDLASTAPVVVSTCKLGSGGKLASTFSCGNGSLHMLGLLTFLDRSDTKATVVKAATSPLAPPSFFLVHIFNRNHARSMAAFVLPWRAPLRCCRPGKRGGGVDAARGSGGAGIGALERRRCGRNAPAYGAVSPSSRW